MKRGMLVLVVALVLTPALVAGAQGPGDWTEYPENPVYGEGAGGGPKAYYPSVLYDAGSFSGHGASARYKMWYGTSSSQTGLATSDDGIGWIEHGVVMADGYHATVEYYPDGFAGANSGESPSGSEMYYRMWYWDVGTLYDVSAIGYTESPDGVDWYNYQPCQNRTGAVPIVSGIYPQWNRGSYGPCDVLYNPSASNTGTDWAFTMYYDGTTGGTEAIGLGFSSDGIVWTGYDADTDGQADPVLVGGSESDWDGGARGYVSRCTVLYAGGEYKMWYSGGETTMDAGIGYATSPDGITWTKDSANPILHKTDGVAWRDSRTYCPAVLEDGSSYRMWFAGKEGETGYYAIGYATVVPSVVEVDIDIKPGSDPNSINLRSKGVVPVAVLTTGDFDAGTVDPTTVEFAGAEPVRWATEDVDGDGDTDLLFHVKTQELTLTEHSTEATLTGSTHDGTPILGADTVRIVPLRGKKSVELDILAVVDQLQVLPCPNPVRDVHTTTFRAMGAMASMVEAIRVRIFDLSGRLVWEDEAIGSELDWHTDNLVGEYLANGMYLYQAQVNVEGTWINTGIEAIAIRR